MSSARPLHPRGLVTQGFTLIEVLVVVAIISLLVSILIPSLSRARDQAKRSVCASNLHQQQLGMNSYGLDNRGFLPWRGWFTYTVSEVPREAYGWGGESSKVLVNLALLIGKHLSKDWNVLYCPSTINKYRDAPSDGVTGGLPTLRDPSIRFTYGGYNYALPMAKRTGAPRLDKEVYPRLANQLETAWVNVLVNKVKDKGLNAPDQDAAVKLMMPRGVQPLVMDWVVGSGDTTLHLNGVNVAYSDGHARFIRYNNLMPGGSGSLSSFELWYYAMTHP